MKAIITCSCTGIPARAEAAYKLKFKNNEPLKAWAGKNMIATLLENIQFQVGVNSNIYRYVKALSANKSKFAYYMEWNKEGNVTLQYNLLTGRQLI